MEIRKAVKEDLPVIMSIYEYARSFMAEHGNPGQWGKSDPPQSLIEQDVEQGKCHVCVEEDRIVNVFYYSEGEDPTYRIIEGKWLNDRPYAVVHRIASAESAKGAGTFSLKWALQRSGNLRIDTHDDNIPMQSLLKKLGFVYCGRITLPDGSERIAFQNDQARSSMA